jgi:hypothetical protein
MRRRFTGTSQRAVARGVAATLFSLYVGCRGGARLLGAVEGVVQR